MTSKSSWGMISFYFQTSLKKMRHCSSGNFVGGGGRGEDKPGSVACDCQVSHPEGQKIDNVPSEMIKLSGMTLIQSLLILETNPSDTKGPNMRQIWFVSGLLLFWHLGNQLSHLLKFRLTISCSKEHQTILFSCIVYTGIFLGVINHQKQWSVTTIPKIPSV